MRATFVLSFGAVASALPAQELRHAVAAADVVVVATAGSAQPHGEHLWLHRLEVESVLRGDAGAALVVVEHRTLSEHNRPVGGERRLYCLARFAGAGAAGLPAAAAPYFKMCGHPGSNPPVADAAAEPALELARIVLAAEAGTGADALLPRLLALVFEGKGDARLEAVRMLSERRPLLDALDQLQQSALLSRAVGETEDVPLKIALAELCAERRLDGLVDALCLSNDAVEDRRFAEALGRIAAHLHGEEAAGVLRPHILRARDADARGRLLLALGATSTEAALEALLRMRSIGGADPWVDAALELHGAPRALEAVGKKKG